MEFLGISDGALGIVDRITWVFGWSFRGICWSSLTLLRSRSLQAIRGQTLGISILHASLSHVHVLVLIHAYLSPPHARVLYLASVRSIHPI